MAHRLRYEAPKGPWPTTRFRVLGLVIVFLGALSLVLQSARVGQQTESLFRRVISLTTGDEDSPDDPHRWPPRQTQSLECYQDRDVGIIERLVESAQVFCPSPKGRSTVTIVDLPKYFRAFIVRDLVLDLRNAKVEHDIKTLAEDGGSHDPRFRFDTAKLDCDCDELVAHAKQVQNDTGKPLRLWHPTFTRVPVAEDPPSSICSANTGTMEAQLPAPEPVPVKTRAVVIARRDDHNPFFQISSAFNSWMLMRAFKWDPATTLVIHLDGGFPSPVDELHRRLLAPVHGIWTGENITSAPLHFHEDVLLPPPENWGPMMEHLNDREPCQRSELFEQFRAEALGVFGVSAPVRTRTTPVRITIISRRNYSGRTVQRRWLNEAEIVAKMRAHYAALDGIPIVIQSIDFVHLTLDEQMRLMLESDIVIGMHGAGMVNVLWTRPKTLVIEIFPKKRRRWGYRNLCQHLDCDWHEFRGGVDTGKGDNASNKRIEYEEWVKFFDPLFRRSLGLPVANAEVTRR